MPAATRNNLIIFSKKQMNDFLQRKRIMHARYVGTWFAVTALVFLGSAAGLHTALSAPPDPTAATEAAEVLTRGPVHEAFAETVSYNPQPGRSRRKPRRLRSKNCRRTRGRKGPTWLGSPATGLGTTNAATTFGSAAFWRDLPPGRQWVPGYWGPSGQGQQWTSGYWADAAVSSVGYLPEPPASAEAGPNIAAPSPDDTWLPGNWMWQENRYAWRPGFGPPRSRIGIGFRPITCGPLGATFLSMAIGITRSAARRCLPQSTSRRGMYSRPGFSYSPSIVIDLGLLGLRFPAAELRALLFRRLLCRELPVRPASTRRIPTTPATRLRPYFRSRRWQHRSDGQYEQGVAAAFMNRRDHEDARPPRTWASQTALGGSQGEVP